MRAGGRGWLAIGIIIGVFAGDRFGSICWASQELNLFRVTNTDPVSFVVVVLLLGVVAAVALLHSRTGEQRKLIRW